MCCIMHSIRLPLGNMSYSRSYRIGNSAALNDLDHEEGTDHTDHLCEAWVVLAYFSLSGSRKWVVGCRIAFLLRAPPDDTKTQTFL